MTIKDNVDNPPIVHATLAPEEPEIDLTASSPLAPTAPAFSLALDNPPPTAPHAVAASAPPAMANATATTTTYTIPPPQQQQHTQSVPPTAHYHDNFGRNPSGKQCRYCRAQMVTRTRDRIDAVTILAMLLILLIFWPLFWLPLCMPACKTTDHYCSSCNRRIGRAAPCS